MNTKQTTACLLVGALLLAGCGGGSGSDSSCSLGSAAGCGGTLPDPGTNPPPAPDPAANVASVDVVASSGTLGSAGAAGTEVTVTALVKTAGNVGVTGVPVQFTTDSGFLSVANATSDANGMATAKLSIGSSKANRAITVSAKAGQRVSATTVQVTGTHLAFNVPSAVTIGSTANLTATLLDSANQPIVGQALIATAKNGNSVTVDGPSASNGQVTVRLAASKRGAEEITVSALGTTATKTVQVGGNDVTLSPAVTSDAGGNPVLQQFQIGACAPIDVSTTSGAASATLNASRGAMYSDAACTQPLTGTLAISGGNLPRSYVKSDTAAVVTVEAALSNGVRGSTSLEFFAPLAPTSWVKLQADQAVVGSSERAGLVAVVRDGTTANNLVKGATVEFSILSDPSGGNLVAPLSALTGSDGVARAMYAAGTGDGSKEGTVIQARIADLPSAASTAAFTVNKRALSIQFGTGNSLVEVSDTVLQENFAVFVSDSAGNPIKDVVITPAVWPVMYAKGGLGWDPVDPATGKKLLPGSWENHWSTYCNNEDTLRNGIYQAAFDTNGNGMLEPGIPLTVTTSGKTDAMGLATVSMRYPKDRAKWVVVEVTVTGVVAGTETMQRSTFELRGLAKDYNDPQIMPPGLTSPYGYGSCTDPW